MENIIQESEELSHKLKKRAIVEGFAVSVISSIPGSSRLKLRTARLEKWLENNYHGDKLTVNIEKVYYLVYTDDSSNICIMYFYIYSILICFFATTTTRIFQTPDTTCYLPANICFKIIK